MKQSKFFCAYVECALRASVDDGRPPLDSWADAGDIARCAWRAMRAECAQFLFKHRRLIRRAAIRSYGAYDVSDAGHDFWLTRNRHGAGFWDRGLGVVGDLLTDAAHAAGERELHIGDDGLIYQ